MQVSGKKWYRTSSAVDAIAVIMPVSIVRSISLDKIDFVDLNIVEFFARQSYGEKSVFMRTLLRKKIKRTRTSRVVAMEISQTALPPSHT